MKPHESLAPELIREFVLAGHSDLEKVRLLLVQHPALLNAAHQWAEDDFETALTAAGHVGNRPIAEYLLAQGAPLDICVAAMLGRQEEVAQMLEAEPALTQATGAHKIPLMFHVALSGDIEIARLITDHGPQSEADLNFALHAAVGQGHAEMVAWLLANGVTDPNTRNWQGKTPFDVALARGDEDTVGLLREYGGVAVDAENAEEGRE